MPNSNRATVTSISSKVAIGNASRHHRAAGFETRPRRCENESVGFVNDLGDGVLCCEFHSKANSIGDDIAPHVARGPRETRDLTSTPAKLTATRRIFRRRESHDEVLLAAQEQEWDELGAAINAFQQLNICLSARVQTGGCRALRACAGGGREIPLYCRRICGLGGIVHGAGGSGVGVIPAGGGCKRDAAPPCMILRRFRTNRFC